MSKSGAASGATNAPGLLISPLMAGSPDWQMWHGERFALEGLLATLKPRIAIEIGTASGGSLRRIAAYAEEVHAFDVIPEIATLEQEMPNVRTHVGDSGEVVPALLSELEQAGREVDFALVDGDHSAAGVQRDAEALLASAACRRTAIVFHDAANDEVRAGLEAVRFEEHPKVVLANLDFVPGYLVSDDVRHLEIWEGLALVLLDADRNGPVGLQRIFFDSALLLRQARERALAQPPDANPPPVPPRSGGRAPALAMGALAGLAAGLGLRHRRRR